MLPFWRWWNTQRGGRRQDAKRPEKRGAGFASSPRFLFGRPRGGPGAAPRPPNAAAPHEAAPAFPFPRATAVGPAEGALTRGLAGVVGLRRGAAAFCGPSGPAKPTQGRGPLAPAPCVVRAVRARRPPGRWNFPPAKRSIHQPFPALPSRKPNEPAAPHERRASIIRCKPRKVFQQVFPRFFQKRQGGRAERRQWRKKRGGSPVSKGVEGSRFSGDAQRPLRTARGAGSPPHGAPKGGRAAPRMKPPTGSRGRAPAGSPPHIKPSKPPRRRLANRRTGFLYRR